MNTIAIDCGASFVKGAAFQGKKIIAQIRKPSPIVHGAEDILKPTQIQSLVPLVYGMIRDLAKGEKEIQLCLCNEMHGFLLCYEDGTPYTDYISWQKEYGNVEISGESAIQILAETEQKDNILHTGMPLRAGLPSCNLLYLSRNGYLEKAAQQLYFYTLGDYLLKRLSKQEPVCHPTNAAATGLYDLYTGTWNPALIKAAGGAKLVFPQIGSHPIHFQLESLAVHAMPAIGDQQAALLGAGLNNANTISFNLGTGAQVSKLISAVLSPEGFQVRPYFYDMYLKTIPFLPSGRALNVYIRFFKEIAQKFQIEISEKQIWEVLLEEAKSGDCNELSCDLSFYENAATTHCTGNIDNIGEYSLTLGNLMASLLEQMSRNFIIAAKSLEPNPFCVEKVIFSGGIATKIEQVRESVLKAYKHDIIVHIASEETLWGLYMYGQGKEEGYDE